MMVAHYRKVLVSFYTKDLCHSISLPFQTEKDASHISMTHAFLCIIYSFFNTCSFQFATHCVSF